MRMKWFSLLLLMVTVFTIIQCNSSQPISPYQNINNPKATYVGMQTCKNCHADIYASFIKTGMGQSWGIANKNKSAADFNPTKALVYDTLNNLYYKAYWDHDSLAILEYQLVGTDTVHKRIEHVSYIVGSGQHTNSHIININGYLHQAPITYYTQQKKWDMAPGFEHGASSGFTRKIEMECMTCHNGYPSFVEGSLNKYAQVAMGIDCERCHGPGSLHVADKIAGKIVDTSQTPDYTIVNPRRLSTELQNNLCQRCHLQGITVLAEGKSFTDFFPSTILHQTLHTFLPQYEGSENNMIMASHVERMKMSNCYLQSQKLSCITCHNPHVSVKETSIVSFNQACAKCHQNNDCKEKMSTRNLSQNNCSGCHMPKNGSIDIPHVAVTDHYIRVVKSAATLNRNTGKFIQLKCYNNDAVDLRTKAQGFLEFHERYTPHPSFIDSAIGYLVLSGVDTANTTDPDFIRALFLQDKFSTIITLCKNLNANNLSNAWTAYRIGEAYLQTKQANKAIPFFIRATTIMPYALDFKNKLTAAYLESNHWKEAEQTANEILKENPTYAMAYLNKSYLYMQQKDWQAALLAAQKALLYAPNHVQSLINMAVIQYQMHQTKNILPYLLRAQKLNPQNEQVQAMIQDLSRLNK